MVGLVIWISKSKILPLMRMWQIQNKGEDILSIVWLDEWKTKTTMKKKHNIGADWGNKEKLKKNPQPPTNFERQWQEIT